MHRWLSIACCLVVAIASRGSAQQRSVLIDEAERAYDELRVDEAANIAQEALETGGHNPQEVARIHRLLGLAYGATNDQARAYAAYRWVLALEPGSTVDSTLSPRLREPFFRARSYWQGREPFGVNITMEAPHQLELVVRDPLTMLTEIAVHSRGKDAGSGFQTTLYPSEERLRISLDNTSQDTAIEVFLVGFDRFGNRIVEVGSETLPETFSFLPQPTSPDRPEVDASPWESPWLWTGIGVGVAAAATVLAVVLLQPDQQGRGVVVFGR